MHAYYYPSPFPVLHLRSSQYCGHPHWWLWQSLAWRSLSFSDRQVPGRLSCGFPLSNAYKNSTLGQLQVNAPNYFVGELSDSSHFTYNSAQHRFVHFSQDFSLVPLPAFQKTIILFATHLAQRIKTQSMNLYLAAVRSLHINIFRHWSKRYRLHSTFSPIFRLLSSPRVTMTRCDGLPSPLVIYLC